LILIESLAYFSQGKIWADTSENPPGEVWVDRSEFLGTKFSVNVSCRYPESSKTPRPITKRKIINKLDKEYYLL
jgi:hypothetical protein